MSEQMEADLSTSPQESSPKDRVGDVLRKERITRRITVETIAKDLKLNVKYIKALENNEYSGLPADPYVRVYLRSLAKYLALDPDEILRKFYDERGMGDELYVKDISNKLEVRVKDREKQKSPMLTIAIVLIVILAAFTYVANKKGWISSVPGKDSFSGSATTDTLSATARDSIMDDSLYSGAPVQPADTSGIVEMSDSTASAITAGPKGADTNQMTLRLQVVKDSVWINVFSDGKSWKNIIYAGQGRDFSATDSFNVNVGNLSMIKCSLNGKSLKVKGGGVTTFKVTRSGAEVWPITKWNKVFKGRIN
jgi:cytoskeletal protein RodZ